MARQVASHENCSLPWPCLLKVGLLAGVAQASRDGWCVCPATDCDWRLGLLCPQLGPTLLVLSDCRQRTSVQVPGPKHEQPEWSAVMTVGRTDKAHAPAIPLVLGLS
jgi:hypothetical protein